MIIPLVNGFPKPQRAPITWVLIVLNFIVFLFMEIRSEAIDLQIQNILSEESFVQTNAQIYTQFARSSSSDRKPIFMNNVFSLVRFGDERAQNLVSQQVALQDIDFLDRAPAQQWSGDAVAISRWRQTMGDLDELRGEHPVFAFGLNARSFEWDQLIVYQFAHSGWSHFLFNMLFLLIFGFFLEHQMKSYRYLQLYLLAGAFAGYAFLTASGSSAAPLVGASGAIGGLIGATLYFLRSKDVQFFAYIGIVRFPFWIWFFYFWILVDVTGIMRSLDGIGSSVAHIAHIGGSIAGFVLAGLYDKAERRQKAGQ